MDSKSENTKNESPYANLKEDQQKVQTNSVNVNSQENRTQQQFVNNVPFMYNPSMMQPQYVYYPTIPTSHSTNFQPQQQQQQQQSQQAFPFVYPQYVPSLPIHADHYHMERQRTSWNPCGSFFKGMKDWSLQKKFNVTLLVHFILLCTANLFYGLTLTFFLLCCIFTSVFAFIANRKKSEMLHGVFIGLTIIEILLFMLTLLIAFPLWGGGIIPVGGRNEHRFRKENNGEHDLIKPDHLNKPERFTNSMLSSIHIPFMNQQLKRLALFNEDKNKDAQNDKSHHPPKDGQDNENKHPPKDGETNEDSHKHGDNDTDEDEERRYEEMHFIINPFAWIGYIILIVCGVMRIKNLILSKKLIKQYRNDIEESIRKEFETKQEQNESVELNETE